MAAQELAPALPGSGEWWLVLLAAPALLLPVALATAALRVTRSRIVTGRVPLVPPRALLRLSAFATPFAVYLLFGFGNYGDCVERMAWNSPLAGICSTMAPAFVSELLRLGPATLAQLLGEVIDDRDPRPVAVQLLPSARELRPMVRLRFGWPLLILLPLLVFGGLMELASGYREAYVLALVTSPGVMVSAMAFLSVTVLALPFVFRLAFGIDDRLPEPLGKRLREVAARLGFPPAAVLRLRTGNRSR